MEILSNLLSAFGLSSAAGLNAYIPLLSVGLVARFTDWIKLKPPYDLVTNEWVLGALFVLLVIELVADKIPAFDHLNDIVQTAIRPTAGAILFISTTNVVGEVNPAVAIVAGLAVAGTVHLVKAAARPIINIATGGLGAPIVSTLEDIVAVALSVMAILLPFGIVIVLILFAWLTLGWLRRRPPERRQSQ